MEKTTQTEKWPLFRLVIPIFSEINIFSNVAKKTTGLGAVMVATAADKLWGWRVEVIDENNYRKGPRDQNGRPDHAALQKENPAAVVGFFASLTSTIERVWELAKFYQQQEVVTLAGGWHVNHDGEESLRNGIDVVVHGDGELTIREILDALRLDKPLADIKGLSYLQDGNIVKTLSKEDELCSLDDLPFPNFNLLKYSKVKVYPIGRIRGCSRNCEFCSINRKPNWASAQYLFEEVNWLVETRGAHDFFIVDDRLEEDREGTLSFLRKIAAKYGRGLKFTVQIRLEAAKDQELLEAMKQAGVRVVCIGFESCIDEDLKTMQKGYLSKDMVEWTKIYHGYGFLIHAMLIFGYPPKEKNVHYITIEERVKQLKRFIRQCHLDTIQILKPIPLVGSQLHERLKKEGRLFPPEIVPLSQYDGNYVCFQPDNMTVRELQEIPTQIMRWFYNPASFVRIPLKTLAFPFDYLIRGWHSWYRGWRNDLIKYGGHILLKRWQSRFKKKKFVERLESYKSLT
jgi:radical SAM superfamily enzyme YgiQ (UPF0313 family)